MGRAYIGLGANVGAADLALERAIERLRTLGRIVRRSGLYRSPPWGMKDQADFVNAVALLEGPQNPHELLRCLKAIERDFGRRPTERWGPRALDLDLLTYDDLRIEDGELTVPHPRMLERAFVLVPLAEIDPAFAAALAALDAAQRAEVVPLREVKRLAACAVPVKIRGSSGSRDLG